MRTTVAAAVLIGLLLVSAAGWAAGWSGFAEIEARGFPHDSLDPAQRGSGFSLALQPEYVLDWDDGNQRLAVVPFVRLDQRDRERTHADLRELEWLVVGAGYEWRVGIRKVFWGVTESQHLVDIINQTDLVENLDGEDKLGQPMVNMALIRHWGTLDLFVLPGFRDRTFPGTKGRLRTQPRVDADQAEFESSRGRGHIDLAARWSKAIGDLDLGTAYFWGTSREPRLLPGMSDGALVLIPRYELIHQASVDAQFTRDRWLWKLETITRTGQGRRFSALTGGVEFTLSTILDTPADLGLIAEYLYDDRGREAPTPFQDDIMIGSRLTFNDVQSSEALIGVIADRRSSARLVNVEASRRLGKTWRLGAEVRVFIGIPGDDPLDALRRDDYAQMVLSRYF